MAREGIDQSSTLLRFMLDACNKYDADGRIQIELLGYRIKDKQVKDIDAIMDSVRYKQNIIHNFVSKTGNIIDIGPIDGILGKQTLIGGEKYLQRLEDLKLLVGYYNPVNMTITPSFDGRSNSYNNVTMRDSVLFENFIFNQHMNIYQQMLNGKIVSLTTRKLDKVIELDIHEAVANTAKSTVNILLRRGCGVHFIIDVPDRDGNVVIYQTMAINKTAWHLNTAHNGRSIGIEIVNPYYPEAASGVFLQQRVIKSKYAHKGKYVLPFDSQIKALHKLVISLDELLDISFIDRIREADGGEFSFVAGHLAEAKGGVMAHYSVGGHADGIFPVYQLWRLATGRDINWDAIE